MISVVVPAHNEAAVIGRLLSGLLAGDSSGAATPAASRSDRARAEPAHESDRAHPSGPQSSAGPPSALIGEELEVVVVANGCTDATAEVAAQVAARHHGDVTVVSTPTPGKYAALRLGDQHARAYPRLYVDADVEISAGDVRALADALRHSSLLAVAPERVLALAGRPWIVRWYYDVWQRLPAIRTALYGRGVIGISEAGQRRLTALPDVMGDDLAASVAFAPHERRVVAQARVVVHPPRTVADLVRRRVRSVTTSAQLRERAPSTMRRAGTSTADIVGLLRERPSLAPKIAVFLAITALARWRARRPIRSADYTTWLRDESSRR